MPFKKGDPRINRLGRPKKGETISDLLLNQLNIKDVSNGYEKIQRKEAILERLIQLALKGDLNAIKYIVDRIDGTPTQKVEADVVNYKPAEIHFTDEIEEDVPT